MNESAKKYRVDEDVLENVSGGCCGEGGNSVFPCTIQCPNCKTSMEVTSSGYYDCTNPTCKAYICVEDDGSVQLGVRCGI